MRVLILILIQILLSVILIALSAEDFFYFKIRNEYILSIILLIFVKYLFYGLPYDYYIHLIYSFLIFFLIVFVYAMGFVGGGDAKLLPLGFVWLDTESWMSFYVSLTIVTLIYILSICCKALPLNYKKGVGKIPYGPCIALAWLVTVWL